MRRLFLSLFALALMGCPWRGVEDLIGDAAVVIVVTGVRPGDSVALDVGGRLSRVTVTEGEALSLYLDVPAGDHRVALRHERRAEASCVSFDVHAVAGASTTYGTDVRLLSPCGPGGEADAGPDPEGDGGEPEDDDGGEGEGERDGGEPDDNEDDGGEQEVDAGDADDELDGGDADGSDVDDEDEDGGLLPSSTQLSRLREVSVAEGCTDSCEPEQTDIEGDGSAYYVDADGQSFEAALSPPDLAAVVSAALSTAADLLFAGDDPECPLAQPPAADTVQLERRVRLVEGGEEIHLTERVDVTGCGGIAASLREHLAEARDLASSTDAGP